VKRSSYWSKFNFFFFKDCITWSLYDFGRVTNSHVFPTCLPRPVLAVLAVFFIFYKVHKTCPGFQKTALQQNIDGQTIEDEDEK